MFRYCLDTFVSLHHICSFLIMYKIYWTFCDVCNLPQNSSLGSDKTIANKIKKNHTHTSTKHTIESYKDRPSYVLWKRKQSMFPIDTCSVTRNLNRWQSNTIDFTSIQHNSIVWIVLFVLLLDVLYSIFSIPGNIFEPQYRCKCEMASSSVL